MKRHLFVLSVAGIGLLAAGARALAADSPYKILHTTQVMGNGGIDYVYADNDGRRVYVPRGPQTYVFNLDTYESLGSISNVAGHGVAIDTESHHGVASGRPPSLFDTATMQKIKDVPITAGADGILFEPFTKKVLILSHGSPSITIIDPKDGTVSGSIDVGGAMEQAQSDGQGKLYVDVEDQHKIAVVDMKTLKLVTEYDLGSTAGGPGGLGLDIKNHILFAMCAQPNVCVSLHAEDGKVLTTLPLDGGTDGGGFNPNTMEAFSSQRNGTLTIIKESSPTSFAVEQTVQTKMGAKTCSLDTKNNVIVLIATEAAPAAAGATPPPADTGGAPGGFRRGGGRGGPGFLDVIFVGR